MNATAITAYAAASRFIEATTAGGRQPNADNVLKGQLITITDAVIGGTISAPMLALADQLATRAEHHNLEARRAMEAALRPQVDDAELDRFWARSKAVETEAARTVCLILGAPVDQIAPCDFPTVVRAYLVARHLGQAAA